ncbi:MAG TPA: hypothetical protein VKU44_00810 [Terriglobia bacterium]|nr:hypothetical protein [Terriglobia bacterium]
MTQPLSPETLALLQARGIVPGPQGFAPAQAGLPAAPAPPQMQAEVNAARFNQQMPQVQQQPGSLHAYLTGEGFTQVPPFSAAQPDAGPAPEAPPPVTPQYPGGWRPAPR